MSDLLSSRIRLVGVALVCAKVAIVPLVIDAGVDWPFVVPKALLSHAIAYAMAGVLLGLAIRFGAATLVRSALHVPVLAYIAVATLAAALAVSPYIGLFGTHARMLGLSTMADWVVLYFAAVCCVRTRREAVAVALCAFGASTAVLAYELVQVTGRDPISWTIEGTDRAFSTIGQPTSLGQYTSTLAVAAFAVAALAPALRRAVRVAMLLLAAALIWGAASTDSRAPVVGLTVAALVLVVSITVSRRGTRDARIAAFAGVAALVALSALIVLTPIGARVAFTLQAAGGRDETIFSRVDESTAGRIALYGIGIAEFIERPLLGYGPDNFVVGVQRYRPELAPPAVRQSQATSAHSWLIQTAASTGVLGLLSLLACFGVAAWLVVRSGFAPVPLIGAATLAAYLGTGLTTVDDVATGWIVWLCLALIAASTATRSITEEASPRASRRKGKGHPSREPLWRRQVGAGVAVVAIVTMVTASSAYAASRSSKTSTDIRLLGRSAEAVQEGLAAVRDDPGRGEYWHTLALAYFAAQRLTDAAIAFDRANILAPYEVGYANDVVQIQLALAQRGDGNARARAIDLANALVARDPNNPRSHVTRAITMQATGDIAAAARSIELALQLDPASTNEQLYVVAVQVFMAAGRPADAVTAGERGIAAFPSGQALIQLRSELDRALVAVGRITCVTTMWRANPASPQAVGARITFAVDATGCRQQESQIAVLPPTGGPSIYLSSGSWSATHVWDTTSFAPGTYRVLVYTRALGWTGQYQAFYQADYVVRAP